MSRNKPHKPRIFCIGWHKTGTSTMGLALLQLNYTVLGARSDMAESLLKGDKAKALEEAGKFDALQDVPWAALFKELDKEYPGSKFILTIREEQEWLNSAAKHFQDIRFPLHEWLYGNGILLGNEGIYLQRYQKHYLEVKEYFQNRPNDLLVMDFRKGDGWDKLCSFLEEPIPKKKFPHANKGKHNYDWKDKLLMVLRSFVPTPLRRVRVMLLEWLGLHRGIDQFNNHYQNRETRENQK